MPFRISTLLLLALPTLHAATIDWVVGDIDGPDGRESESISTAGNLIKAANFGSSSSPTINTVAFTGIDFENGGSPSNLSGLTYDENIDETGAIRNGDIDAMLRTGALGNTADRQEATLTGLTSGNIYQVQFFLFFDVPRTHSFDDREGNVATLTLRDPAQFVTGTFIADGTTQAITLRSSFGSQLLNGYQLRELGPAPELDLEVTTLNDEFDTPSGTQISLREAIRDAQAGDVIGFGGSLNGSTIALDSAHGPLSINQPLRIDLSPLFRGLRLEGPVQLTGSGDFDLTAGGSTNRREFTFTDLDVTTFSGTMRIRDDIRLDVDSSLLFTNGGSVELISPARVVVDQLFLLLEERLTDSQNGIVSPGFYFQDSLVDLGENYFSDNGVIAVTNRLDDSDGDGLPDFFEDFIITFDPEDNVNGLEDVGGPNDGFATDFDNDGLTDADEFLNGPSNPVIQDTDTDGLLDGPEVKGTNNQGVITSFGPTDPLLNDTDDDGYDDGIEIVTNNNPLDSNDLPVDLPVRFLEISPVFEASPPESGQFDQVQMTFTGLNTKKTYQVFRGSDLQTFPVIIQESFSPTRSIRSVRDREPPNEPGARAFYRLGLKPPAESN